MKKIVLAVSIVVLGLLLPLKIEAAWTSSGNNDYKINGFVGLGMSNPADPLHINSTDANFINDSYLSSLGKAYIGEGAGSWWILGAKAAATGDGLNNIASNSYLNNGWKRRDWRKEVWILSNYITGNNTGYFRISHSSPQNQSNISNLKPIFNIDSLGNTTIDGTLVTKQVKVKSNVWSDYVFEEDYNLKSLGEVEEYVKANNRLPGIPSSQEVLENGIDIGDMQRLQMEKIEELTLYTIEQNKRIELLERRL